MSMSTPRLFIRSALALLRNAAARLRRLGIRAVYFGRCLSQVPDGSLVVFPLRHTMLGCGIAGIVAFKRSRPAPDAIPVADLDALAQRVRQNSLAGGFAVERDASAYLGGESCIESLWRQVQSLKRSSSFGQLYGDEVVQAQIDRLAARLAEHAEAEGRQFDEAMGGLNATDVDVMTPRLDRLRDIAWCLRSELLANILKVRELLKDADGSPSPETVAVFRNLNAVLNSIDRMEVRGRDSAGISLLFVLGDETYRQFASTLTQAGLQGDWERRREQQPLLNRSISLSRHDGAAAVAFTYKVAVEIGSLGDNIRCLRQHIAADAILHALVRFPLQFHTVNAHTRWASVGAITEANCHPVDNQTVTAGDGAKGVIHACLNGDIDNFLELKEALERDGCGIHAEVTTDTKIIPLQIERHLRQGVAMAEAFRRAVCDFKGSHAIAVHTDLAPGKLFLAHKGSGQAIFVGIAPDHYMSTSEVYGFIEETQEYIKLDGESIVEGRSGKTQGQIVVLDQEGSGLEGITSMYYDGTPCPLSAGSLKRTALTSRDIDRQDFPHYFFKEISESPGSVAKTLQNRWKIKDGDGRRKVVALDERVVPARVNAALADGSIRRIYFIGQGTAGVAALACANVLNFYLNDPSVQIQALKASEFSGFFLGDGGDSRSMNDTLVIAISQSGTTTDTNRSVDMVRQCGAHTLAIVNRRDSDLTFKVNGVMYTSSGRDIEMSVASTKAFYAQIIAGALLSLHIAGIKSRRDPDFVSAEIDRLLAMPGHMRRVLAMADRIRASASRLAVTKTYWAAVGSGPNKASADEIRIKLSELCYKTISSDFVEDKKHIDLSSEPLIMVCAAGTRPTVIGDIIKDTAIFKAHKATPVVICDEGEDRFDPYAEDVFQVPAVAEHLAPILNTLVGHLWGYHAALSIHEGSRFLYRFHEDLQQTIRESTAKGIDVFELILDRRFRELIVGFYSAFRQRLARRQFPATVGFDATSDLTLLLKYLAGRLEVSDFELDFGLKGTAANMLQTLSSRLAEAIGFLARPVDAIKHQAKTVTVGTSRISERIEGLVFAALAAESFSIAQLTPANLIVLKNVQGVIREIEGSVLYRIDGLNLLGDPGDETTIEVLNKRGKTAVVTSRVETDRALKGSKRIIVRQGNVYIGKGRKDDRSILVIPLLSPSSTGGNRIEHLLLLHVAFKDQVPLTQKIRALGGKYEHIQNIVQENSVAWQDEMLDQVPVEELFGRSAEKVGEFIVQRAKSS